MSELTPAGSGAAIGAAAAATVSAAAYVETGGWLTWTGRVEGLPSTAEAWASLVHPEDADGYRAAREAGVAAGSLRACYRVGLAGGSVDVEDTAVAVSDGEGRVVWRGVRRMRRAAAVAGTEDLERVRRVFAVVPDPIALVRVRDRVIVDCNDSLCVAFGRVREEMLGRTPTELGLWDDLADRDRVVEAARVTDVLGPWNVVFRRKDGTAFECILRGRVLEIDGEPVVVAALQDVTALQETLRALRASEERWALALQASHDGIFDWDLRADRVYWAPRLSALMGLGEEERMESPGLWRSMVVEEDREATFRALEEHLEGQTPAFVSEHRVRLPSGEVRWILSRGTTRRDAAGRAVRVVGAVSDIHPRKEAEERVRSQEEHLRQIFATLAEGVLVIDRDLRFIDCNESAARILGVSPEILLAGSLVPGAFAVSDRRGRPIPFEELPVLVSLRTGEPVLGEIEGLALPDGRHVWLRTNTLPLRARDGSVARVLVSFADVTGSFAAEAALRASEERYRLLVDSLSEAVMLLGPDGAVAAANPAAVRLFGVSAEAVVVPFDGHWSVRRPDGAELPREQWPWWRSLRQGVKVDNAAVQVARPDADSVWVVVNVRPLAPGAGGAVVSATDVTDRRRAEAILRESEERFRLLVESSGEVLLEVAPDGRLFYASPALTRVLGWRPVALLGQSIHQRVHPEDAVAVRDLLRSEGGMTMLRWAQPDGNWRWMETSARTFMASGGDERRVLVMRDVTERRSADEMRQRLEQQVRIAQKMEAIGNLAGGIAHDFNNILTSILANVEVARLECGEGHPVSPSLANINTAAIRARDLTAQILTMSRRKEQVKAVQGILGTVDEVARLLRATLPASISIRTRVDADAAAVYCDAGQIHQVLMNLCTNAAHAMRSRSGTLEVRLVNEVLATDAEVPHPELSAGKWVRLSVRDTGHGIAPEIRDRIFDPFFTTKPQGEGTGLGLAVVDGIVRAHGGAVTVESELGKGTVFHIWLPPATAEQAEGAAVPQASATAVPAERPASGGKGERVLFVDDEAPTVEVARRLLPRLGYEVVACTRPEDALAAFRAAPGAIDAMVTDLTMPGMSGLDLAAEILETRPDLPIVLASGFVHAEAATRAAQLGVREIVEKPFTAGAIAAALRRVFEPGPGASGGLRR